VSINHGFTLLLSTGRLRFTVYSNTTAVDVSGTSDLRDDSWHHVAGIWDGSFAKVYVDKKLEGRTPWTTPPASTTANLGIGKRLSGWGGYMPFLGSIDEVRISTIARDKVLVINVPADYPTIQGAVDAAYPNNIIHVWNGTYFENIVITTPDLKLIGQSQSGTIIDGMGVGDVILVTNADNVEIIGFTIQNSGPAWPMSGIYLNYSSGNTIWSNHIWSNVDGITMIHSYDNNIRGNEISENYYGIWAMDSVGSTIVTNNFTNSAVLNLDMSNCSNCLYYNNIINPSPLQVDEWPPLRSMWDDGAAHPCSVCGMPQDRGNYWSDYPGADNGLGPLTPSGHKCANDGVGDTSLPHMPTTGSPPTDWYPLMNLYTSIPGDVDLDGDVDIFDVVILSGCYGATWSNTDWTPQADIAAPFGKIDIFDVVLCSGNYGKSDL
jgi:parallel beta-helix repeat protein